MTRFYRGFCRQKAALLRAHGVAQAAPDDATLMQHRGECRTRMVDLQEQKLAGRRARSRIRWKHRGDQVSREFFWAVREQGATARITALHDANGQRLTYQAEIEAWALAYYTELCASNTPSSE